MPAESPHEIREESVKANGLRFRVLACGEGERQALLLHGFPESAETWRRQLQLLAGLGYRAWAPDMRGYGGSERPEGVEAYALEHLLEDVRGLIEASGAERVLLVGHDWGGIISWFFAVRHPEFVERLIQMNIPHPACFRANYSPRQWLRSLYALVFQIPRLPERLIARERISRMIERTSGHPENHDPVALEAFDRNVRQPGTSTAMFNYYRALIRGRGMKRQHLLGYPPFRCRCSCSGASPTWLWASSSRSVRRTTCRI